MYLDRHAPLAKATRPENHGVVADDERDAAFAHVVGQQAKHCMTSHEPVTPAACRAPLDLFVCAHRCCDRHDGWLPSARAVGLVTSMAVFLCSYRKRSCVGDSRPRECSALSGRRSRPSLLLTTEVARVNASTSRSAHAPRITG